MNKVPPNPGGDRAVPALLGGVPVCPQGAPVWPVPDEDVLRALQALYADGSWGKYHGASVEYLEDVLTRYHGVEFAMACGSGTYAIELALRAMKIGPGDEVLLSAYDYPGNFLNIHAVGALPVLVDVAADNWNLDPGLLEKAIGPTTRALIVSHLHGGIVPMNEVMEVMGKHGLPVIEDAAQSPGATVQGRKAGTWGDVGVLSFGGSKLLTAGRGGALLTRRADLHQRARVLLKRGNIVCPLSELQAAVLMPQLAKLDFRNGVRTGNVRVLAEQLRGIDGLRPFTNCLADTQASYYKLGLQFDAASFGLPRDRFLAAMRAEGIALDEGFKALHVGRSPSRYRSNGNLVQASRAHAGAVVLHHPLLLGPESGIEKFMIALKKVQAHSRSLSLT